jgi:hypothetical protein
MLTTENFLVQYWEWGVQFALFVVGLFIVKKLDHSSPAPFALKACNTILFASLAFWFLTYLLSTRLEIQAMLMVFEEEDLPGANINFLLAGLGLSIGFIILLLFHRNLFVIVPAIFLIGYIDMYGNNTLSKAMQQILVNITMAGREPTGGEKTWIYYYIQKDHIARISLYLVISFLGVILYSLSKLRYLKPDVTDDTRPNEALLWITDKSRHYWLGLECFAKLVVALAILLNEFFMFSWRAERENQLFCYDQSIYYQWLPGEAAGMNPKSYCPSFNIIEQPGSGQTAPQNEAEKQL